MSGFGKRNRLEDRGGMPENRARFRFIVSMKITCPKIELRFMRTENLNHPTLMLAALVLVLANTSIGQTKYAAWGVQDVVKGNHDAESYGILNDFAVLKPVTIYSLGAFDSEGDG